MLIYVDDIIVVGSNPIMINYVMGLLAKRAPEV